jgi:hypothetical protein
MTRKQKRDKEGAIRALERSIKKFGDSDGKRTKALGELKKSVKKGESA